MKNLPPDPTQLPPRGGPSPDLNTALQRATSVLGYLKQNPSLSADVRNMLLERVVNDLMAAINAQGSATAV